jgi:glycosyltransferase involved in cell wall biosynthesis
MACGAAVVTSNNSSLPEVAGDAALLIDARDVEAIAWAIGRFLQDSQWRGIMQRKAQAQAKKFSWDKSADQLRRAFHF